MNQRQIIFIPGKNPKPPAHLSGKTDSIRDHRDGIYNFYRNEAGLICHRSYGYLVNPAVGKVLADWWQQSI